MFLGDNEGLITFNMLVYSNLDCNKKFQLFFAFFLMIGKIYPNLQITNFCFNIDFLER